MRTLVCAATRQELAAFGSVPEAASLEEGVGRRVGEMGFLLTGVGIPWALAAVLETASRERPAHILNLGIAGAYPGSGLAVGDIVIGHSEVYGDVGFELPEPPWFRPVREAAFGTSYRQPFPLAPWPSECAAAVGRGCTVNACTGTEATGRLRESLFQAAFETMEGAAVAQAGARRGIPVSEVRAISNIAGRRDMRPENIRQALDQLAAFLEQNRNIHGA